MSTITTTIHKQVNVFQKIMVNWDLHVSFSDSSRQKEDPAIIANIQATLTLSDSLWIGLLVLLMVLGYIQLLGYWFFVEVILISLPF